MRLYFFSRFPKYAQQDNYPYGFSIVGFENFDYVRRKLFERFNSIEFGHDFNFKLKDAEDNAFFQLYINQEIEL